MIKQPTVLVLGAGASMPYGFPSGEKLLVNVVNLLRNYADGLSDGYPFDKRCRFACKRLSESLLYSGLTSVDQFLESHIDNDDFMEWGKKAIVECLLPVEIYHKEWMTERNFINKDDWYSYLWRHLKTPSIEDFPSNKLSIITFNYDRSLEEFLYRAIKYTYGLDHESDVIRLLGTIDIVHVHGSLGAHPALPPVEDMNVVPYGGYKDKPNGELAWDSIKVVHESSDEGNDAIERAIKLIYGSKQVAFLGFGYLEDNLRKLKYLDGVIWGGKIICGSTNGMSVGDMVSLCQEYEVARLQFNYRDENSKCLEFLRNTGFLNGTNVFNGIMNRG